MNVKNKVRKIKTSIQSLKREKGEKTLDWRQRMYDAFREELKKKNLSFELRVFPGGIHWKIEEGTAYISVDNKETKIIFSDIENRDKRIEHGEGSIGPLSFDADNLIEISESIYQSLIVGMAGRFCKHLKLMENK